MDMTLVYLGISFIYFFFHLFHSITIGAMFPRKPTDQIDCAPFVVGMITVLKQFHCEFTEQFFACCGQYVRSLVEAAALK